MRNICSVADCTNLASGRGFCNAHYQRFLKRGTTDKAAVIKPWTTERLEEKTEKVTESGCWLWLGSPGRHGYGEIRINNKIELAHRLSWKLFNGDIPRGMQACHRCDVRSCVNPSHLFLGTNMDNILDSMKKGRRLGVKRNRPSGLKYNWSKESKARWLEKKRKINAVKREEIFALHKSSELSNIAIGRKFGCSGTTVFNIIKEFTNH